MFTKKLRYYSHYTWYLVSKPNFTFCYIILSMLRSGYYEGSEKFTLCKLNYFLRLQIIKVPKVVKCSSKCINLE